MMLSPGAGPPRIFHSGFLYRAVHGPMSEASRHSGGAKVYDVRSSAHPSAARSVMLQNCTA